MQCDSILLYSTSNNSNSVLLFSPLFLNVGSWQSQNQAQKRTTIKKVSRDNSLGFFFSQISEKGCIWSLCPFNLAPESSELFSQNHLKL